jgi:predicted N-acetyltransferase YhbS
MTFALRKGEPDDAAAVGAICYAAFNAIAGAHNFPPDFPSPGVAIELTAAMLSHPRIYSVIAERDGKTVGSNFLWERDAIAGVGPITVDPAVQDGHIGRALMQAVLERADKKGWPGVRLVQAAYHNRSLSLYAKLGFDAREPLTTLQGPPIGASIPGYEVRKATINDIAACNALCQHVHGHDRDGELREAVAKRSASVVEHAGRIVGYATLIGFFGHAATLSNDALKALIAAAPKIEGPGILAPTRNSELLRWCLENGLRAVQPMTLMSRGLYNDPRGAYLPSILF